MGVPVGAAELASKGSGVHSARQLWRKESRRIWLVVAAGTLLAAGCGVIAAKLTAGGLTALKPINPASLPGGILVFPLILIIPAAWRWPRATLVGLLAATTLIDQFQYQIGPVTPNGRVWQGHLNIAFFHSLSKGSFVTPAEMVLFLLLLNWTMKGALTKSWSIPRSPLAKSIAAFFAVALVIGVALGVIVHHGQIKVALWELRPWYYVAVTFLLTASLFAGRNVFRPLLWTIVLGSGLKSIEGVFNFFTISRNLTPRPDAILGHEESFFFGVFLLASLALWVFRIRGPIRILATVLSPVVLLADLANSRRTGSLLIYVGIPVLLASAYVGMPEYRKVLKRLNVVFLVLTVVYLGFFWNHGGTVGQPARAVHSAIAPSARDLSSNQYRTQENTNLILGLHSTRSVGKGFGVPINYGYSSIVDLTTVDSMIAFVPHNGVLYVWYRLGIIGEIVLWSIIGFGILAGSRLVKGRDRETKALGAIAICAIVAYVLMGYNDLGFSWVRIAIFMGFVLGALEASSQRSGYSSSTGGPPKE